MATISLHTSLPKPVKYVLWFIFFVYSAILVKIIIIKKTGFFIHSLRQTWRHGGFKKTATPPNWTIFKTINNYLSPNANKFEAFANVGGNIIIFIPFGILVAMLLKGRYKAIKTIFLGFLLSTGFEFFQLYTSCGNFDIDDIILNTAGTIIGVVFWSIGHYILNAFISSKTKM
jgi:glycopeptide antibiotics resistance protein